MNMRGRYKYLIWDHKWNDMDTDFKSLDEIILYFCWHKYKIISSI